MKAIKQIATVEELYPGTGAETGNVVVDAVVEYATHTLCPTAEDAAVCLGVEQRWLSLSIKIFVGVTLPQFLWEWRLRRALDMLDDESLSYDVIAERNGFSNSKHMAEAFRKFFKVSPYQYRTESLYYHCYTELYNSAKKRQEALERVRQLKARPRKPAAALP